MTPYYQLRLMNSDNARTSALVRPDPNSSLGAEAALAMASFLAGSLTRHVKPWPLACVLAVGGFAWRWLMKKRPPPSLARIPDFANEADFLRHFQQELAQPKVAMHATSPVDRTDAALSDSPAPLKTEEEFLRLFKAEMEAAPILATRGPDEASRPQASVPMENEEDFFRQFHAEMAGTAPSPIATPDESHKPGPDTGSALAPAIESSRAAPERVPEQAMAQNGAWLLGLEPLSTIEFEDISPTQSMPAQIPDRVEIFETESKTQRPSTRGRLEPMLEHEPAPMAVVASVETVHPPRVPEPRLDDPDIAVQAWLQAGASQVGVTTLAESALNPRRTLPRAPVTVPIESDPKGGLNWWK